MEDIRQELEQLETSLAETYCEAGKALMEVAEIEGRKINRIVDQIVTLRRMLAAMRMEQQEQIKEEHQ